MKLCIQMFSKQFILFFFYFLSNLITKERICQLLPPRFKMADHSIENITTNLVNPFESVWD